MLGPSWNRGAAFAVALALIHFAGCGVEDDRPSVVLVTIDALRADHLGCYGYVHETSPNLDRLAGESLVFERCFANASETRFSVPSLFTGFLPHETRALERLPLPAEARTLAEMLRDAGYRTAAVVGNYVLRADRGYAQGFDRYDDDLTEREQVRMWPERTAEKTTDRAVELLRQELAGPFFLWVHYQDPHGPYTPPTEHADLFRDRSEPPRELPAVESASGRGGIPDYQLLGSERDFHEYVARYDGEIHYQDAQFARLVAALKERGLYDKALIVVTADHGEALGEHGYYFTHGDSLYREQLHVPLIVRHGDSLVGRRAEVVQHLDVVPTILGVTGIEEALPFRGRDLRVRTDEERGIAAEMNTPIAADSPKFSIVRDGWKLIHTPSEGRVELYDLEVDPFEERDLAGVTGHAERIQELTAELVGVRSEDLLGVESAETFADPSEEELEKLRSLGYLD